MSKGPLVCCLALLVVANLTRAQPTAAPPVPAPSLAQPEAAQALPPGSSNGRVVYPVMTAPPAALPVSPFATPGTAADPWFVTADAEFLLWTLPSHRVSRIATLAGPASVGVTGDLGNPDRIGPPQPVGRITIGAWAADEDPVMHPCVPARLACWGGEVRGFYMMERSVAFGEQVAVGGLGNSSLRGRGNFNYWGLEANARCNAYADTPGQMCRLDLIGGIRYLNFDTGVSGVRSTIFLANIPNFPAFAPLAGRTVEQTASFQAGNEFYGAQFGLAFQFFFARAAVFGGDAKIGLGGTHQQLDITGAARVVPPAVTLVNPRFPADSGSFSRNTFSYVPELNLYLGMQLRENISVRAGYNALYWSAVGRAADQINLTSAGAAARVEIIREKGLFVHGLDLGIQVSF